MNAGVTTAVRKKMEQEVMDEERKEINEFKTRYMANRKWRGYCLCSANMFTLAPDDSFSTICFEDLAEACFLKHHLPDEQRDASHRAEATAQLRSDRERQEHLAWMNAHPLRPVARDGNEDRNEGRVV